MVKMTLSVVNRTTPLLSRSILKCLSSAPRTLPSTQKPLSRPELHLKTRISISQPTRSFSQSSRTMSAEYFAAVKGRRTYYPLKKESPISDEKIQEIVGDAILHAPSSFNSQSSRAVLLLKDEHDKLWDIAKDSLKAIVSEDQYKVTEQKLNMFQGAYGTVLFFISKSVVKGMQEKFPSYAAKFPQWATHSDGMAQHITWTALEAEGLGANLQHYNPLIDAGVQKAWNVPEDWELCAQLVFGGRTADPGEKTFTELSERLKVYGL